MSRIMAVEVDGLGVAAAGGGEGEQALGQRGGPLGPGQGIRDAAMPRLRCIRRQRMAEQGQIAVDDLQQIVEIVGDAAGELADRLHLLRLAKRFLGAGAALDFIGDAAFERLVEDGQGLLGIHPLLDFALRASGTGGHCRWRSPPGRQGL